MRRWVATVLLCGGLILLIRPPQAASGDLTVRKIAEEVDELFLMQDAAAHGVKDAEVQQKQMLIKLEKRLSLLVELGSAELSAIVTGYVLSGGNPLLAETLAKKLEQDTSERSLLEGAAFLMRGHYADAQQRFTNVSLDQLPHRTSGRVSLAMALMEDTPLERQRLLSRSMAEMPGTLIEEASLRRSAIFYADQQDNVAFWSRLKRYERRFPESLYAKAFWNDVMIRIANWRESDGARFDPSPLDDILSTKSAEERRRLYLDLARKSATANNASLAEFAAARVLRLSSPGMPESHPAALYNSLYAITGEAHARAFESLKRVQRDFLLPHERILLEAALHLGTEIEQSRPGTGQEGMSSDVSNDPLLKRGKLVLDDVERLPDGLD